MECCFVEDHNIVGRTSTYQEISSQAATVASALNAVRVQADQLQAFWAERLYEQVIFTGCGSTYYLSLAAASVFQMLTGVTARAVPAGELLLMPQETIPRKPAPILMVAISRSGTTTETLQAVKQFQQAAYGTVLTITCNPDNTLSKLGRINITIPAAAESSVVQTRSFSSMWVAACALAGTLAGRKSLLDQLERLPEASARITRSTDESMRSLGGNLTFERIYFLGSGLRHGLAREASLKMKEMSLTHSEPFHFLEFRHGPKSMVNENSLVVGLLSDDLQGYERSVLHEVQSLGARILAISDGPVEGLAAQSVVFDSNLDEIARSALYLPPVQYLALGRAVAKGLNPDEPRNLEAVVYLGSDLS